MSTQSTPPPTSTQSNQEPSQVRLLRTNWVSKLERTEAGVPVLPPSFVVEQGRLVEIIDIREAEEMSGPLGHIPGVRWVPYDEALRIAQILPPNALVILVSRTGEQSAKLAKTLEELGMTFVASMIGGMVAWRNAGFTTTRDESFRDRTVETLSWDPSIVSMPAQDHPHAPLTLEQIKAHVGDPRSVRWVKMATFLMHGKISCVDGRDDHGVVGTPGGDAGELLLALAATELVTGRPINRATLTRLLARYIDTFGHLYLHSDTSALNRFILAMRADPRLDGQLPPRETQGPGWRKFMSRPPRHLWSLILEHLLVPEHIGCGHIRLMYQNNDEYDARSELVRMFLEECYTMTWGGAEETQFVVLGGGHQESAVVSVRLAEELFPFTRVPLVSPAVGATQMFIAHPDVTTFLRRQIAAFMTMQRETGLVRSDRERLFERMTQLAERQLKSTLGRLAKGLPHYVVRFEEDQSFTVF